MEQYDVPEEMRVPLDYADEELPASVRVFKPVLFIDGDSFCCVLGPDPQAGVFGCGDTSKEALIDWEKHLIDRINYNLGDDEVSKFLIDNLHKIKHK